MNVSVAAPTPPPGRYAIYDEIASGGMATVHFGRLVGPVSFARTVAIKRLHPHLAREPEFVAMFLDEARVAARIRHPNVVPTLDIVTTEGRPFLVMEYVQGESLARLLGTLRARGERISVTVACSIVVGVLQGLHAAHEARGDRGESLGIVHRDVSPQNVIVGIDGVTRLLDFGVAKAAGRLQTTREGQLKGKLAYTAPEIVRGGAVTRAADVYSAAVVLWEALTGERLFAGDNEATVLDRVLHAQVAAPSRRARDLSPALDPVVLKGLARDPAQRFATAREMARAIEAAIPIARAAEVGEWVGSLARQALDERSQVIARIETGSAEPQSGNPLQVSGDYPTTGPRRSVLAMIATAALGAIALTLVVGLRGKSLRSRGVGEVQASSLASSRPPPPANPAPIADPPIVATDDLPTAIDHVGPTTAPSTDLPSHARPASIGKGNSRQAVAREIPATAPVGTPKASPPTRSSCDPPWNIDSRGIKQYKLECL
jgi:serine/threonine-protein kinase